MQGLATLGFIVRAPRRLAVDGDDFELACLRHGGIAGAQAGDPVHEARLEQLWIQSVDDIGQGIVARDVVAKAQIAAQKIQTLTAPFADLDMIIAARDRGSQNQQHDLGQREYDLGALARIVQSRKVIE